jgi:hypothetical protein
MALGDLFKLAKLTLTAYKTAERRPLERLGELEVQFNPESLTIKHEVVSESGQSLGSSSAEAKFSHRRSQLLNVSLVFDGTNVGDLLIPSPSVATRVQELLRLCYQMHSETHEPAYLRLTWSKGVLGPGFDCRLQSVDIKYTTFNRDGSPLHAELAAVFVEALEVNKRHSLDRLSSPDLSHRRVVRSGDTLPLLCREIYGSNVHYLRVAEVNGLDDFRVLVPGRELFFPPFDNQGVS